MSFRSRPGPRTPLLKDASHVARAIAARGIWGGIPPRMKSLSITAGTEIAMDVVSCTIVDLHQHPRLTDRTKATVRVLLREELGGVTAEHLIDLRLVVVTEPDDQIEKIRRTVLVKTAKLLLRLTHALEASAATALRNCPSARQNDDLQVGLWPGGAITRVIEVSFNEHTVV